MARIIGGRPKESEKEHRGSLPFSFADDGWFDDELWPDEDADGDSGTGPVTGPSKIHVFISDSDTKNTENSRTAQSSRIPEEFLCSFDLVFHCKILLVQHT